MQAQHERRAGSHSKRSWRRCPEDVDAAEQLVEPRTPHGPGQSIHDATWSPDPHRAHAGDDRIAWSGGDQDSPLVVGEPARKRTQECVCVPSDAAGARLDKTPTVDADPHAPIMTAKRSPSGQRATPCTV